MERADIKAAHKVGSRLKFKAFSIRGSRAAAECDYLKGGWAPWAAFIISIAPSLDPIAGQAYYILDNSEERKTDTNVGEMYINIA